MVQESDSVTEPFELTTAETRLALFQAVSRAVNSSLVMSDIFDSLGEVLQQFLPFEAATIVILDETHNRSKVIVNFDSDGFADIVGEASLFPGMDPLLYELIMLPEPRQLGRPCAESVLVHAPSAESLVVPLISKGLVIGAIGLSGEAFDTAHLTLLADASEQIAVAVENARLYWQTQAQAGREFLINQITKSIRQSLNIQDILEVTVAELGKVMGVSRCLIHYWRGEGPWFEHFEYTLPGVKAVSDPMAMVTFERELFSRRSPSPEQYNPFILNDCAQYQPGEALLSPESVRSLAVFPILLEETNLVGVIALHQCDTLRSWLGEEIELLRAIGEHVAVALHQASLFQEKENQRRQLEKAVEEVGQAQMQLVQSEKMAVLGQFVAGIAHEINTPLGTLISNDDTVGKCLDKIEVAEPAQSKFKTSAQELLKINKMAGDRIQEIVRNLRNFARLDESDLKHVDLHEGLESTLLLINSSLKHRIEVVKHFGELPQVECFPGLLNQVFLNLLVNASQAIEGKGQIAIETHHKPFTQEVDIVIRDSGKGIPKEHMSRIFDPGFTTKGVGVGTGLGLALCFKIIEKHHGTIHFDSEVGVGTTATITVPVSQHASSA